jgi:hypothetical protein
MKHQHHQHQIKMEQDIMEEEQIKHEANLISIFEGTKLLKENRLKLKIV